MLVALSTCASKGGAFFFGRDRRGALPVGCSLLDVREVAEETGISVDDVIAGLDDFASADALLSAGVPRLAAGVAACPGARRASAPGPAAAERIGAGPIPLFADMAQDKPPAKAIGPKPVIAEVIEAEPIPLFADEAQVEPPAKAIGPEPIVPDAVDAIEPGTMADRIDAQCRPVVEALRKAQADAAEKPPAPKAESAKHLPAAALSQKLRRNLEELRRLATVRVEAADEEETEDEPRMSISVPEGYVVRTTTETTVWPWEVREDLTLQEAIAAIDDKTLASLTEEVVSCTISGRLGEGGIKSLCETYRKDMETVYSAIQRESRRRITRMSARTPARTPAMDATQEMALRMAKQLLQHEMRHKAMRFKMPYPDAHGNYCIIQSHRVEDESTVEFPNERTYYREVGDGWAISVGY